jgi:hypothetical protein
LVLAALALGILTHLLLDFPTHRGWLSEHVTWMQGSVGPFTVIRILHFGASVLGAVIIAVWTIGWVRRTPRTTRATQVGARERVAVWIALSAILVGTCLTLVAFNLRNIHDVLDGELWFFAFCAGASSAGAAGVVLSVIWWVRKHGRANARMRG